MNSPNEESYPNKDPQQWPEPIPLFSKTTEAEAYPLEALPEYIKSAVQEVQATTQAPIAMVATAALAALSVAGQAHFNVARDGQLNGPITLFALVLADSGERKSSVDDFFSRPIREYQAAQTKLLKPDIEAYNADMQSWLAKKSGVLESIKRAAKQNNSVKDLEEKIRDLEHNKPKAPKVPTIIYGDATPEALTFGLAEKWPSAAIISSEAGTVFGSHGMGAESVTRNLSALNVLWDGGELRIDRRTSESFTVRNSRLTMSLQVQFPVLVNFWAKQGELARGSGFLARFLVAWPESTIGTRKYQLPPKGMVELERFNARITQLLNRQINFDETGDGLSLEMLKFSKEAKTGWVNYFNLIEDQLSPRGQLREVKDVASKSADNAARIAALFHLFEDVSGDLISESHAQAAAMVAGWHLSESCRVITELSQDPEMSLAAKLDAWLIEQCKLNGTESISTRDVLQKFPSGKLRKITALQPVLKELISTNRVKQVSEGKRRLIYVNPHLLEGGLSWD